MKFLFIPLLLTTFAFSQVDYPKDYFRSPLDIPIIPSGTFAELRTNHFHAGLDIKTQQREGLNVYTVAEGYVSRIKVSHYGYGKVIYITHPNGYTSVYGHLSSYAPTIEAYIKANQYKNESYEVELFPAVDELKVNADEIIAYSGNTGSSGGPHLHFEIRDQQERTINPLLFGLAVQDKKAPFVTGVYAYTKGDDSFVNGKTGRVELRLIPTKNKDYNVEGISAIGTIGFGVISYDSQDLAVNQNGINGIETFFNGQKKLEMDFNRFSFDESKHINRFIDYELLKTKKSRIQKLFVEQGNVLSLYKDLDNDGYVIVEDSTSSVYKIRIKDFHGNESWVNISINGKKMSSTPTEIDTKDKTYIFSEQPTNLNEKNVTVYFPANSFYEDTFINFRVSNDTLYLHKDIVPLQKNVTISYDISNYKDTERDKLYIAELIGYRNYPSYLNTKRKDNILTASSNALGTYALVMDTQGPKISASNFQDGKWLSNYRFLKFKITDNLSGISNYRATVNGKFILMEYEYKTNTLTFDFNDNVVTDTKNELKLIVTDNVGNSFTFEATFFRK
ncbi:peptidase M23-like protein [Gelidibacter algens]|uniref:Peptidase M23-like protein n=1 Tax=Gelidibacter algens TaxID=49280 RepID=A0A1A7R3W8_9FLAO|nr:M23 family metallopeptidase [Gelidibacter algens]OBX26955.1 peptidase M23 [Gelidibacter algens]RAJ26511.1 peptidase M23-like protein [Gelidibacter algens]